MLYLRLAGGLGNQIFQIVAANLLIERQPQRVRIVTDALSSYNQKRRYEVNRILKTPDKFEVGTYKIGTVGRWMVLQSRCGKWLPYFSVNDHNFWKRAETQIKAPLQVMDGNFQRGWNH